LFASEPRVFTFSLHCAANFFSKRETSDRDVEIPAGASDEPYVAALERELPSLFATVQPQLVFFQAGVDPHESDAFGKLCLSSAGLKRRNALVFSHAREAGARVVVTMGGGYPRDLAPDSVAYGNVVQAHMDVYRAAASANRQRHPLAPGR
jgi:acetoin utilization deacetylase AcuC-like enzyme